MASAAAAPPPPPPPPPGDQGPELPEDAPDVPLRQCTHCKQRKHDDQFVHLRKPGTLVGKCLDCRQRQKAQSTGQRVCSLFLPTIATANFSSQISQAVRSFSSSSKESLAMCSLLSSPSARACFLPPNTYSPLLLALPVLQVFLFQACLNCSLGVLAGSSSSVAASTLTIHLKSEKPIVSRRPFDVSIVWSGALGKFPPQHQRLRS
ncbi:hypothetical protein TgHK011_006627 [Trichoderma gracile]|nr:hypothetical protein TgHK011_006627 [Trichoderma gracile]